MPKPTHTWTALHRLEVIKAVERKKPARIPLVMAKWWGEGLFEQYGARLNAFDIYPEDAVVTLIDPIEYSRMGLSWHLSDSGAKDANCIVDD